MSPFSVLRSPFSVLRSPFSVLRSPFSVLVIALLSFTPLFAQNQNPGNGVITITSATYSSTTHNITITGTMAVDSTYSGSLDSINAKKGKQTVSISAGTVGVDWTYTPDTNPPAGRLSGTWTKVIALTSGTWDLTATMTYISGGNQGSSYSVVSSITPVTVP